MRKVKKKSSFNLNIFLFTIIAVLLCVLVYFIFSTSKNNIDEADVMLYADLENVSIDNSLPVNDKFGKNISDNISGGYKKVDFEIVNVSSKSKTYQLYIKKNNLNTNEINNDFVKFYLTDDKNNPIGIFDNNKVPSYRNLSYIKDKADSKVLYSDKIDKYQRKKFIIRVWVTDNYVSLSDNYFSFDIGVRSI